MTTLVQSLCNGKTCVLFLSMRDQKHSSHVYLGHKLLKHGYVYAVTRIKISKSRSGQRHSEETRRKMSIARKQYWENWHQEKMRLQPAGPSKASGTPEKDGIEEPQVKVPRPKRKAWYKQSEESKAAEE